MELSTIISEYSCSPLMIWEYHGAGWDRDGGCEGCHRWLYSLGSTQPWVSSDVKLLLIDFEIAIFSSSGVEHGLSRCWTTWRAQRAPWARQLIASPSLLRNYSLLNPRFWWELQCNENGAKFVYQTPGPWLMDDIASLAKSAAAMSRCDPYQYYFKQ